MDYWILLEHLSFEYQPDGDIIIRNNNTEPINGLSLVVNANNVRLNNEIPESRKVGNNTIFWFDLLAKQSVKLKVER